MDTQFYENMLAKWERTSRIGRAYCQTRAQAQRMAWVIANKPKINKTNKILGNISSNLHRGTEPSAPVETYVQMELFERMDK